ncbi:MAG: hypothetical protein QOG87_586 [Actinomycetota bacterium]|jgi:hypothetical protein
MRQRILIIAGIVVLALGLTGGAIAVDAQNDDASATGPDAERAGAAAVASVGGGQAREIERDPEGTRVWKVEVAREDGVLVDVELDGNYKVVTGADDANEVNEPDDANEPPEAPETVAQDAAEDAGEVNEAPETEQPDNDADDTEDGDSD